MNLNEFLNQAGDPIIYNIWARTSSKGTFGYAMQLLQTVDRNQNTASRRNFLLSATQGSLSPRKLTAIVNLAADKAEALFKQCAIAMPTAEEIARAAEESVSIFSAKDENRVILINDLDFFGSPIGIELTESPFPNRFTPNQKPVVNPVTGEVKMYAYDGVSTEVYAHTEVAPADLVSHQFIEDYFRVDNDARRDFPEMVMEQIAKVEESTIQSVKAEVEVTEEEF